MTAPLALALALAAAACATCAAYAAWRARRVVRGLADHYAELVDHYRAAVTLIVLVARADPPVAHPHVVALCNRMLEDHGIEHASVTMGRPEDRA